jgi:hypothetical protein
MSDPITIDLKHPFTSSGVKVSSVKMRRPTVDDMVAAGDGDQSDARKEVTLFANLCMLNPGDLGKMDFADFKKLQAAFASFAD